MKIFLLIIIFISGCEYNRIMTVYERAPLDYTCNKEQMNKVEQETDYCAKNTSYISAYCYGAAIIRNCTKKEIL